MTTEENTTQAPAADVPADTDSQSSAAAMEVSDGTPPEETVDEVEGTTATVEPDAQIPAAEADTTEPPEPKAEPEDPKSQGSTPKPEIPAKPERPEVQALRQAKDDQTSVEGRVIGWNRGGFHVVIGGITAFCPRSEMELGHPKSPKEYLDQTFPFQILKVQKRGRRVVVSRTASLKSERSKLRSEMRQQIETGATLEGRIATLTDFGAFVDLGAGIQGLVHISEISHQRIDKPQDLLEVGQDVNVKVLGVEKGGKRISLSMRALESNPWSDIRDRFPGGTLIKGKVQKTTRHGAVVELAPGITGLLPTSAMSLPRDASIARAFPPGREVSVQVVNVDDRRHRISLVPEGSAVEGTWHDFQSFRKDQDEGSGQGFNALADALKKARIESD